MKKDYAYCSGVACPIREECRRYLPDPPDKTLEWMDHPYDPATGDCEVFE